MDGCTDAQTTQRQYAPPTSSKLWEGGVGGGDKNLRPMGHNAQMSEML